MIKRREKCLVLIISEAKKFPSETDDEAFT